MKGARVEVTLVPHGFEVDVWRDCDKQPGVKRVAGYCFSFGDNYPNVDLLANNLAQFLVKTLRKEPTWLYKER